MERRDFIKTTCLACLGGSLGIFTLEGCGSTKSVTGSILGSDLIIPLAAFGAMNGDGGPSEQCVIAHNAMLQYPVCVYRLGEDRFVALLMRCTHQGTELQVFGDRLECPAHGSKFDNSGEVLHGPAEDHLRTFPVTRENTMLKVSLK